MLQPTAHIVTSGSLCCVSEQMFGVFLLVFVRPSLAGLVRGVCAEVVRTGFGSDSLGVKAGNKGGIAVRLDLGGASMCIVNSHLPCVSRS